ncbi:HET domain containing protein [Hyaloscypha variabilis]
MHDLFHLFPPRFPEPSIRPHPLLVGLSNNAIQYFMDLARRALVGSALALTVYLLDDAQYLSAFGIFFVAHPDMLLHLFAQIFIIMRLDGAFNGQVMAETIDSTVPMLCYIATSTLLFISRMGFSFFYKAFLGIAPASHRAIFWTICAIFVCLPFRDRPLSRLRTTHLKFRELDGKLSSYRNAISLSTSRAPRIAAEFLQRHGVVPEERSYAYAKLGGPQEIRLLKLSRQNPFVGIHCQLIRVRLDDAPPYECISYAWGKSRKTRSITIDGSKLAVTPTVHSLLWNRGSFWKTTMLWIDSICINQDDNNEKNEQVRMMRDIYQEAQQVIVWLGDRYDADLTVGLLEELYWESIRHTSAARGAAVIKKYGNKANEDPFESFRWKALIQFFSSSWFGRIWVVQEVAVARRVGVIYGSLYIPWNMLVVVSDTFFLSENLEVICLLQHTGQPGVSRAPPSGGAHLGLMESLRCGILDNSPLTLARLLEACQDFGATDPKDKVFAIQGISDSASDISLLIDYNKEIYDVYLDTANYLLNRGDLLKVLQLAGIGWPRSRIRCSRNGKDLPSWVPDWGVSHIAAMMAERYVEPEDNYCASGRSKPQIYSGNTSDTIKLGGLHVGTIDKLGTTLDFETGQGHPWEASALTLANRMLPWYAEVHQLASTTPDTYLNGQPRTEALWRTLIGDRVRKQWPAPHIYGQHYRTSQKFLSLIEEHMTDLPRINIPPGFSVQEFNNMARYNVLMGGVCQKRKFCITKEKYLAIVPPGTKKDDMICIIHGAQTPLILRHICNNDRDDTTKTDAYAFIGECYVHGIMKGEMLDAGREIDWFDIQ